MSAAAPALAVPARLEGASLAGAASLDLVCGEEFPHLLDHLAARAAALSHGPPSHHPGPGARTPGGEGAAAGGDGSGHQPLSLTSARAWEMSRHPLTELVAASAVLLPPSVPASPGAVGELDELAAAPAQDRLPDEGALVQVDARALFRPEERACDPCLAAAGPFVGRGLFTVNDPGQAIRPGVSWVAVRPEALTPELVQRLRQAGIRLVIWEAKASQAGLEAVRRYGAEGYIAQAEGPDELAAALRVGEALSVPKALVTNNFMDRWPPGWIALPEAYSGQNPLATVERVVFDARARGAQVVVPVLGLFAENGRGPSDLVQAARDLARLELPGVAIFTAETAGRDLPVVLGEEPLLLSLPAPRSPAGPSPAEGPSPASVSPALPSPPSPGASAHGARWPLPRRDLDRPLVRAPIPADAVEPQKGVSPSEQSLLHRSVVATPDGLSRAPEAAARGPATLQLAARVADELRLLAREGRNEARIILRPPDLGEVRIRVLELESGVTAFIVADSAQVVDALASAVSSLRRALEGVGVPLLGVDLRLAGGRRQDDEEGREAPSGPPERRRAEDWSEEARPVAVAVAKGALIDVLA